MTNKITVQKLSLLASDGLSLVLSLALASLVLDVVDPGSTDVHLAIFGLAKFGGVLLLGVFWYQEQYMKRRPTWEEIRLLYRTIFIFALLHLVVSYLISHHVVKLLNIMFWLCVLVILPVLRHITKLTLSKLGLWQRNVYIVGTGPIAIATCELLEGSKSLGYRVIGFIDLESATVIPDLIQDPSYNHHIPIISYSKIVQNDATENTEIVFAMQASELLKHSGKIDFLQSKYLFVSIVPDVSGLPLYGVEVEHFFGSDQLFLRLQNNLGRKLNRYIKRCMDVIVATIMLVVLSPLLIMIAVLVKLSSHGPALYKHRRLGINGSKFFCLKFRTMHVDSEIILEKLLATDENARLEWQSNQKMRNDPRVTGVGKFLRKTSLDELPQLFNVIFGEMSLVGPRPIVESEISRYGDSFYYYKMVSPGITGLWQISGRSDTDYVRRVQFDVWYVKNWSLWYDWVILLKTVPVFLIRNGAY